MAVVSEVSWMVPGGVENVMTLLTPTGIIYETSEGASSRWLRISKCYVICDMFTKDIWTRYIFHQSKLRGLIKRMIWGNIFCVPFLHMPNSNDVINDLNWEEQNMEIRLNCRWSIDTIIKCTCMSKWHRQVTHLTNKLPVYWPRVFHVFDNFML